MSDPHTQIALSTEEAALLETLHQEGGAREWTTFRRRGVLLLGSVVVGVSMLAKLGVRHDLAAQWLPLTLWMAFGVALLAMVLSVGTTARVHTTTAPRLFFLGVGSLVAIGAFFTAIAIPDVESVARPYVAAAKCFGVATAVAVPVALLAFWLDRSKRTKRRFALHLSSGAAFGVAVLIAHCPIDDPRHAATGHLGLLVLCGIFLTIGGLARRGEID